MFTTNHFIWLAIVFSLIAVSLALFRKYRPSLRTVLTVALVVAVLSELIKVFSAIEMVPSADGTEIYPYIKTQHLPFHLCSLQILLIVYTRFSQNERMKNIFLAFMYPTCTAGAFIALLVPSIFSSGSCPVAEAFTNPVGYQYFIFHGMLVVLGICIPLSGEVPLGRKQYVRSLVMLLGIAFVSIYLNSLFADAVFEDNSLVSVEYTPNFFFTYNPPIDIPLTELWHWYIYITVLAGIVLVLMTAFFLPFIRKEKKANRNSK